MIGDRHRPVAIIILSSLIFLGFLNAMDLEIGGPRKVLATVRTVDSSVSCMVSFIPVSCFDTAMNRKVNQQKAQNYALLAMAKASGTQHGTVTAPNLHPVTPPTVQSGRFYVTYQADAIRTTADPRNKQAQSHPNSRTGSAGGAQHGSSLLSCFEDMGETLQTINGAFNELISELKASDDLEDKIANLEAAGVDAFEQIAKETKSEKLLLTIEKDDLLHQISSSREGFLQSLEKAYTTLKQSQKLPH